MPRDTMGHPKESKEEKERQRRWQAEDDFRTLGRAAEIHGDEGRKAAVLEMHQEHGDMLKKLFTQGGEAHKADGFKSQDQGGKGKTLEVGKMTDKSPNYSRKRS